MATTTLLNNPGTYSPVYGQNFFRQLSGSYSLTDWKYLFKVYNINQVTLASTQIGSDYKVPPRPTNDGLFDVGKILRAQLSYDLDYDITDWTITTDSLSRYRIRYGFEYNPNFAFTSVYNSGGNLGLNFGFNHDLLVNDEIVIDMTNQTVNPQYNGEALITSITATQATVNITFVTSSVVQTGNINLLNRIVGTSSDYFVYNGTRQYDERTLDFYQDYRITPNGRVLNNFDSTKYKKIYSNQYETLSMLLDYDETQIVKAVVSTYNTNNTLVASYNFTYSVATASNLYRRVEFPSGTQNLTQMGVSFTGVDNYKVGIQYYRPSTLSSGFILSNFRIVSNCSPYELYRIGWLNSNGAFEYFNFNLASKEVVNATRIEYKKELAYNYNIGDRGRTNLSTRAVKTITINTDWIDDYEMDLLKDLIYSSEIYHIKSDGPHPIILQDTSMEYKYQLKDMLFNLTLSFQYAYDIQTINN